MVRALRGEGLRAPVGSPYGLGNLGLRHDGSGAKGKGYFGPLQASEGVSTEISTEMPYNGQSVEIPTMVPTLTAAELAHLLRGSAPTEEIYRKADDYAVQRLQQGKSPFAANELYVAPGLLGEMVR